MSNIDWLKADKLADYFYERGDQNGLDALASLIRKLS